MKRLICLLSGMCLLCLPAITGRAMAYSVSLDPVSQTVEAGESADVNVNLMFAPGEQLLGFSFSYLFDPSILAPNDPVFPAALADYETTFDAPEPGLVTFEGVLGDAFPLAADVTPLATLSFSGVGLGTSPLVLFGSITDFSGDVTSVYAAGDVSAVPEPATLLLLGSGLVGLAGCAKRRKRGSFRECIG